MQTCSDPVIQVINASFCVLWIADESALESEALMGKLHTYVTVVVLHDFSITLWMWPECAIEEFNPEQNAGRMQMNWAKWLMRKVTDGVWLLLFWSSADLISFTGTEWPSRHSKPTAESPCSKANCGNSRDKRKTGVVVIGHPAGVLITTTHANTKCSSDHTPRAGHSFVYMGKEHLDFKSWILKFVDVSVDTWIPAPVSATIWADCKYAVAKSIHGSCR